VIVSIGSVKDNLNDGVDDMSDKESSDEIVALT
jgi:hypothetical protein